MSGLWKKMPSILIFVFVGLTGFPGSDFTLAQADPLLPAATYYGGSGNDGWADNPVVEAPDGSLYVAASTRSLNLPMPDGGYDTTSNGNWDIFVAHFNADMSQLLHATYLGGAANDAAWPGVDLILSGNGSIYVTSTSSSTDFPITAGAYSETYAGAYDIVVAKLSSDLSQLEAATFLGGSGTEDFPKLALHPSGDLMVTCCTVSSNFPVTEGAYRETRRGGKELAISRISADLSTLVASTYLGSALDDWPEALVVYGTDEIFLTGWTRSQSFPTTDGAFMENASGGTYQAFVSCLSSDLTTLVASTYISGNSWEFGYDVILDETGKVYACGHTASTNFPGTGEGYQSQYAGSGGAGSGDDMWVARFDHDLTTVEAATYLGGSAWENAVELALVPDGIMVGGTTSSANWPATEDAFQTILDSGSPIYTRSMALAKLDRDLIVLEAATFLGGDGIDNLGSLIINQNGDLVFGGSTSSYDFPVGSQAYQSTFAGGSFDYGGDVVLASLDTGLTGNQTSSVPDLPRDTGIQLQGAFPNPFNPRTEVAFSLDQSRRIKVDIHDVAGRHVKTLANRIFTPGDHRVAWQGRDRLGLTVSSGTYLVTISDGHQSKSTKLVLGK